MEKGLEFNYTKYFLKYLKLYDFDLYINNDDEIEEYYLAPAMAKLWRYSNLWRKARRDGQGRLPLKDKSKEREYFESFIKRPLESIVDQYLGGTNND